MQNLYYLSSSFFMPSTVIMVCCSIALAIYVITVKNPVISVLFLIGLFITVGSYLIIIGIGFIGLSYLLVYVGAVSILFLFILMLINIRISELMSDSKNSIPLVFLITLLFSNISFILLPQEDTVREKLISGDNYLTTTVGNWDSYIASVTHITSLGNIMYSSFAILLLLVSLVLLLAMTGAITINIKQNSENSFKDKIINDNFTLQ